MYFTGRNSAFKKCDVVGTLWSSNYTYQSCSADTAALLSSLVSYVLLSADLKYFFIQLRYLKLKLKAIYVFNEYDKKYKFLIH